MTTEVSGREIWTVAHAIMATVEGKETKTMALVEAEETRVMVVAEVNKTLVME